MPRCRLVQTRWTGNFRPPRSGSGSGGVNCVFTPSAAEIAFAERVVDAFARAEREGSAAIQVDGKFIDYPIVYRAQRILEKVAALRAREGQ
jgi:citrate lyase beta subunit